MSDRPNRPQGFRPDVPHYNQGTVQPIDLIRSQHLDFCEGAVVKYVCRWRRKGTPRQDLEKARDYIEWLLLEQTQVEEATARIAADVREREAREKQTQNVMPIPGEGGSFIARPGEQFSPITEVPPQQPRPIPAPYTGEPRLW